MDASTRANLAAARWVFKQVKREFPADATDASVSFESGVGGYCETCSYDYNYVSATVFTVSGSEYAEYDPGYTVDLGEILTGMLEEDDV